MADFCNSCNDHVFGEDFPPGIDVPKIFEELEPGYYMPTLCEGCGMLGVLKNEEGVLKCYDFEGQEKDYPLPMLPS